MMWIIMFQCDEIAAQSINKLISYVGSNVCCNL